MDPTPWLGCCPWESGLEVCDRSRNLCCPNLAHSSWTLQLSGSLVNALRAHRRRQAQTILEAGSNYDREVDLVFANDLGGLLDSRNMVNRYFKPALASAALSPEYRLYDLRHSHATLLLHEG